MWQDLIKKLLVVDPNQRLTAEQCLQVWMVPLFFVPINRSIDATINECGGGAYSHIHTQHEWVLTQDDILKQRDLTQTVEEMKKFNARRKFRAAAGAVMLMNRLKLSSKIDSSADTDADMDESASGPIVFQPVRRPSILTTTLDKPAKQTA